MNVEGRTEGLTPPERWRGGAVVSNFDDVAVVHAGDDVAEMEDAVVVSDDDDRAIGTDGGLAQQLHDLSAGFVVERGGRFVADKQFRLMHEAAHDRHALLLAAGELRGKALDFLPIPRLASTSEAFATARARDQPAITRGIAAFSAAVRAGNRLYCWKTKPMFLARYFVFRASPIAETSSPKITTLPASPSRMPAMTESSVVLPQPEGPTSRDICPASTSQSTPRSAATRFSPVPKYFSTPRMRTAARGASAGAFVAVGKCGGRHRHTSTTEDHGRLQHDHAPDAQDAGKNAD